MSFSLLLAGHDTIECAYYLAQTGGGGIDFERLAVDKEELRQAKVRKPKPIKLGSQEFLLYGHGTKSGYPFLLENDTYSIQCGEFNNPSFYVTFRSFALWQFGAWALHQRFLTWAEEMGLSAFKLESLSRVDFTFDYLLPEIDFDEDAFVSLSAKDNQHRKNRKIQTFRFGEGDIVLRVYDKIAEILESSAKAWFFELWGGITHDVWRIEWQVRKATLRRFSLRTFDDLKSGQGDVLRYLSADHTTLRVPNEDGNRSRWPLHPLWLGLQEQIKTLEAQGVYREIDPAGLFDERLMRIAISMYGYLKRIAAIDCIRLKKETVSDADALLRLERLVARVHDPLTWDSDVQKRVDLMRLGEW